MLSKRHEAVVPPKSPAIKQDNKFFTRIMSKETSIANSSCRIYYGGASGAVPFMWESRPGTPKHNTFPNTSVNPPLTPPPSYYSTPKSKSMHKRSWKQSLMNTIFPRLTIISHNGKKKTTHDVSPSSFMSSNTTLSSSSSSSSSSSFYSSSSPSCGFKNSKSQNSSLFSCSRSPIHCIINSNEREEDDDNEQNVRSPISTLCYGGNDEQNVRSPISTLCYDGKGKGLNVFGGCYLMEDMKTAFLSIVRHGSR